MTTSRGHQGAHGIGQAEKQLNRQANAAETIQGSNSTDQEVLEASNEPSHMLDEVIDVNND
ncbi:hypothetical protein [Paenibacillus sacheonensis]|uniref:Uncharacterized protein n=1 Tax=Paenibacillus sacheonensis TaxID=742054 RepID=A0A7X4YM15_9BACL|nr:hypothetical protein [Paenibacillus sacheonensis]MBM7565825.1 hypothetical protein [Paenibacillus sacheonensis]NBC68855.1 hypothetical protein [Paenibacillus sacheonensis]